MIYWLWYVEGEKLIACGGFHKVKEKGISEYSSACYTMENTDFKWKEMANMISAR